MKRLIFALLICLLLAGQALAVGIIDGVGFSNYLLYDDFLTDYDSDHLNGTAPEPGPGGTKFVVDTNKVMRTSNGKLVVTAGSVGVGDPRIYWDARTRQPGKILICGKINTTAGENLIGWGDSTSTVPDIMYWDFYPSGSQIYVHDGVVAPVVGSFTAGVDYTSTLILSTAGGFCFVKGGTQYPFQTLLWITTANSTSPLYPGFSVYNTTCAYTADFIKVAPLRWCPSPCAYDDYTGAWGTLSGYAGDAGYGAGGGGLTWTGATWATSGGKAFNTPTPGAQKVSDTGFATPTDWTDSGSTFVVATGVATGANTSDTLTNTAGTAAIVDIFYQMTATFTVTGGSVQMSMGGGAGKAITASGTYTQTTRATTTGKPLLVGTGFTGTVDDFSVKPLTASELSALHGATVKDVFISADWTIPNGTQAGLIMNCDATKQNYMQCHYTQSTGKVMLMKCLGGVYAADLLNVTAAYAAGAILRVRKLGLDYYVFYNGVDIGKWTANATTDAAIINNTLHGPFSSDSSATLGTWSEYGTGSAGENNIIDLFCGN